MRTTWAALAAVLLGLPCAVPAGMALADDGGAGATTIGGYSILASAPGLQMIYDNTAGVGGSHPTGYGTVPEATASLDTGPVGKGLASVVWPGSLLGNLGASTSVLPYVSQLPGPVLSLVQQNGNDPIKAEATTGGNPDAQFSDPAGAAVMTAHADGGNVDAQATAKGFEAQGGGTAGSILSHGTATAATSTVTAVAHSEAHNINLGAGLVTIQSVVSDATATSDGSAGKGTGATTVTGLMVGGQPATVDQDGLHVGGTSNPVTGPINQNLNTALNQAGLTVTLAAPQEAKQGAAESFKAGTLVVSFTPPGDSNGDSFQFSFGGAQAQVNATVGTPDASLGATDTGSTDTGSTGTSASLATTTAPTSSSPSSDVSPAPVADVAPSTPPPSLKPLPAKAAGGQVALAGQPIAYSKGLSPGLVVLGLLGVALAAFGLRRLSTGMLAATPPTTTCPLEQAKKGR